MFYKDKSYLTYEYKLGSFGFGIDSEDITEWKSTGINNYSSDSNMNAIVDSGGHLPNVKNDGRIHVHLIGNYFQQNKIIRNNNNAINIYRVYELVSSSFQLVSTRDTSLLYKMLYLELCKLLKMLLIVIKIITKDMVYVLMKEVNLVIQ